MRRKIAHTISGLQVLIMELRMRKLGKGEGLTGSQLFGEVALGGIGPVLKCQARGCGLNRGENTPNVIAGSRRLSGSLPPTQRTLWLPHHRLAAFQNLQLKSSRKPSDSPSLML